MAKRKATPRKMKRPQPVTPSRDEPPLSASRPPQRTKYNVSRVSQRGRDQMRTQGPVGYAKLHDVMDQRRGYTSFPLGRTVKITGKDNRYDSIHNYRHRTVGAARKDSSETPDEARRRRQRAQKRKQRSSQRR